MRIREIRPDTLAQLLSHSNVFPGSRVIVADSTAGLVTAGILERLGGSPNSFASTSDPRLNLDVIRFRDRHLPPHP
jgi:Gcd10p family